MFLPLAERQTVEPKAILGNTRFVTKAGMIPDPCFCLFPLNHRVLGWPCAKSRTLQETALHLAQAAQRRALLWVDNLLSPSWINMVVSFLGYPFLVFFKGHQKRTTAILGRKRHPPCSLSMFSPGSEDAERPPDHAVRAADPCVTRLRRSDIWLGQ